MEKPSQPTQQRRLRLALEEARACRICEAELPLGPGPLLSAGFQSKLVVIGQAPGSRAHLAKTPWADASGDRLRAWLGLTLEEFYDPSKVALIPMGFCYPGTGKSGDLPPREECAPLWHERLLENMPHVELRLVLGRYAMERYLGLTRRATLTSAIRDWREHLEAGTLPLPHPSPRNNRWLKSNPWFAAEVLPVLEERCRSLLG